MTWGCTYTVLFSVIIPNAFLPSTRRNILPHISPSYLRRREFSQESTVSRGWTTDTLIIIWLLVATSGEYIFLFLRLFLKKWMKLKEKNNYKTHFFRFVKYYMTLDGQEERTLIKAYGIRFDVIVFGTVGHATQAFINQTCMFTLN